MKTISIVIFCLLVNIAHALYERDNAPIDVQVRLKGGVASKSIQVYLDNVLVLSRAGQFNDWTGEFTKIRPYKDTELKVVVGGTSTGTYQLELVPSSYGIISESSADGKQLSVLNYSSRATTSKIIKLYNSGEGVDNGGGAAALGSYSVAVGARVLEIPLQTAMTKGQSQRMASLSLSRTAMLRGGGGICC